MVAAALIGLRDAGSLLVGQALGRQPAAASGVRIRTVGTM